MCIGNGFDPFSFSLFLFLQNQKVCKPGKPESARPPPFVFFSLLYHIFPGVIVNMTSREAVTIV